MTSTATIILTIDDVNPQIAYTGQWELAGGSEEYNSTAHGTRTASSQATLVFNGSWVSVFGTIGRENDNGNPSFAPVSTYTVDGSEPASFTGTPVGSGLVYGQAFFNSGKLDAEREHTLVVTNTFSGRNRFWLDYVQIETTPTAINTGEWKNAGGRSGSTSTPWPGIPSGVIVGAVVGGVLALILLLVITILLISLIRRRSPIRRKTYLFKSHWPKFFKFRKNREHESQLTPFMDVSETSLLDASQQYPYSSLHQPYDPNAISPFPFRSPSPSSPTFGYELGYTAHGGMAVNKPGHIGGPSNVTSNASSGLAPSSTRPAGGVESGEAPPAYQSAYADVDSGNQPRASEEKGHQASSS
ncbi:hypothetical protein Hypma_001031 [Hypsizygus marmoreus]|uniref:Transmembrane protein n=1 Tax=Hypsizygus marmoreus TaxID=39966 RepID=A0A369J6M6_HYPMA|nr:hypothetical protein Hypma_001031 [Hypsizygus marmoreus]